MARVHERAITPIPSRVSLLKSIYISRFADVKYLSIDFDWLNEDAYHNTSLPSVAVDMTPLLFFEQLEHLWISSHLDAHAYLFIPESINPNMSILAKHLHLTSSFSIDINFLSASTNLKHWTFTTVFCFLKCSNLAQFWRLWGVHL